MDALAKRLYTESIQQLLLSSQLYRSGDLIPEQFAFQASQISDTIELLERGGHREIERWLIRASEPAAAILRDPGEKPPSIVGNGLLVRGTVAVFYGQPGLGKTWLLLQLAHALAAGRPWLNLPTVRSVVGFISLELPRYYIAERLERLAGDDLEALARVHVVCRPTLKGPVDLLHPLAPAALSAWVREHEISVVILDPLSRAHSANENAAQEMGRVLSVAEQLAAEGPLVLLNHHEGHPNPELGSQHPRGSSRLLSDPNTVLNLTASRGNVCLKVKKINLGVAPETIYLKQSPEGVFEVSDRPLSPEEAADETREILAGLIASNPGLKSSELAELLPPNPKTGKPISQPTMSRHLSKLKEEGRVHSENPCGPGGARSAEVWFHGMEER